MTDMHDALAGLGMRPRTASARELFGAACPRSTPA